MALLGGNVGLFALDNFIHIRRLDKINGKTVALSGVSLYPDEWRKFQYIMRDIDRLVSHRIWQLSKRACVWKNPDGRAVFCITTDGGGIDDYDERVINLHPDEWKTLLSVAHTIG